MAKIVNICDVCSEIFAGGDAPKGNMSETKTEEYNIPIYANGEANEGLYGYTNKARVTKPSITVSARGTIGYTAIRPTPFVPIVRLITLTPNPELIDIKYLYYAAQNYKFDGSGTSIPQLTVPSLKKYSFPLPAMEEQAHIVMILDNVCDLIDQKKQQLELLDELVKSRFIELFGDVANSPKYSGVLLGTICSTLSGGTPTTKIPEYYQGDIPWISTPYLGNNHINGSSAKAYITEDAIKNSATHLIPANTIMFGIRVGVGKSSIIDEPMCANQDIVALMGIDTNKYNLLFVKHVLDGYQSHFDSIKKGATILGITTDDLKKVMIPVVEMELQNQFATFVEHVDKSKVAVQKALDEAQTLFDSLMQEYFG